ncbi:unnamed protein product, partial [Hymenolepis diminuta]
TFLSGSLAQHLAACKPGLALNEEDEIKEEEDKEESLVEQESSGTSDPTGYRVIGTLSNPNVLPPSNYVETILKYEDRRDFYEHIFECDCIIYNITGDENQAEEALWVANSLANDLQRINRRKTFILVTHLLTWARSKFDHAMSKHPTFEEGDHAKRKPHPLYKQQYEVERAIYNLGKRHKKKLAVYVVASGIPYGGREDVFEQFFLKAWMNSRDLEVYGDGNNIIPTIHSKDLARIIQAVFENRPKSRYIVARDGSESTLGSIIGAISKKFSTGEIRNLSEFDLFRLRDVSKVHIDQLMMDIVINTPTTDEELPISWQFRDGIIANIDKLAAEYLEEKNFKPLRIFIIGAPFVGKSTLATALARHYGLHYIHITPVLLEAYLRLRTPIIELEQIRLKKEQEKKEKRKQMSLHESQPTSPQPLPTAPYVDQLNSATLPPSDVDLVTDPTEITETIFPEPQLDKQNPEILDEEQETIESELKLLDTLPKEVRNRFPFYPPLKWENKQELEKMAKDAEVELRKFIEGMKDDYHAEDHIVIEYLRQKLLSKPSQNQGFVLDGWPLAFEQVEALFKDSNEVTDDPRNPTYDPRITPHHVIYLKGSNSLVKHRFATIMEQQGINIEEIDNLNEQEGLSLDLETEIRKRRKANSNTEKKLEKKKKKLPKKAIDLKIRWKKQPESPERRLRRRLEAHRSLMSPKASKEILEKIFEPFSDLVKSKKKLDKLRPFPRPRKPLASKEFDPLEENVITYFDLREIYPFIVDMDLDKSQQLYPGGPQKATFKRLLERISESPTGDFVRRMKGIFDPSNDDEEFVQNLTKKMRDIDEYNRNLRKESGDILNENESEIWHEWLMLLKKENNERQTVKNMPRRNYLLKYILPKISECLVIYGLRRPSDPVEFLAEYLLQDVGINSKGNIQ